MHYCEMCNEKAYCKEKKPLIKGDYKKYMFYCKLHTAIGLKFGWLEKDDLKILKRLGGNK